MLPRVFEKVSRLLKCHSKFFGSYLLTKTAFKIYAKIEDVGLTVLNIKKVQKQDVVTKY